MKRFLTVAVAMLALTGMGQVAMRKLEDLNNTDLVCVTNYGPQVVSLTARVTGLASPFASTSREERNSGRITAPAASAASSAAVMKG